MLEKEMIDFTVIVTIYNCGEYAESCFRHILDQNSVSLELICIDDSSSDGSLEIIRRIAESDSRVSIISNNINLGPASSRNIGLNRARGRYVCFVDGDDMLREGSLVKMKEIMTTNHLDILSFSGLSFSEDRFFDNTYDRDEYDLKCEYPNVRNGLKLITDLMNNADNIRNCVFNCLDRGFINRESIRFQEGLRYADDNMFKFIIKAKRVLYTNHKFYMRRYRKGSTVTSKKTLVHLESFINSYIDDIMCWSSIFTNVSIDGGIINYLNKKRYAIICLERSLEKSILESFSPTGVTGYYYKYMIKKESMLDFLISETEKKQLLKAKNVYIYGAMNNAILVSELLDEWGKKYSFVTTSVPLKEKIKGVTVSSFEKLLNDTSNNKDDMYFVIATSPQYHEEIARLLSANGFAYCKINN